MENTPILNGSDSGEARVECPLRGHEVEGCPIAEEHCNRQQHLIAKNVFAGVAAALFIIAVFVSEQNQLIKAVAYAMGALAYIGELLVMTGAFTKRMPRSELFMPFLFGFVYIMMGVSYTLKQCIEY